MKIAILGYGQEGKAAYKYWNISDNQITICDKDESITFPNGVSVKIGENYLSGLEDFDLIIRTAGLQPDLIIEANTPEIIKKITTSTNEFFKMSPSKNIIGVTGTKGKGTTSTLIARLLESAGKSVYLAGNIGTPAIELLNMNLKKDDWVVLELSSYQLTDVKYSPFIGVCLMIVPEHLNWHLNLEEYIRSKGNIFKYQSKSDIAIYYEDNLLTKELAELSAGIKVPYYKFPGAIVEDDYFKIEDTIICKTDEIKLLGTHNWQNICAAITAYWQVCKDIDVARKVITSFKGLEHRIEFVRKNNNISYYNDSFASVPDATIAAISAIPGAKVLIIGGFDRGLSLELLALTIKDNESEINKVVLIGQSANRMASELDKVNYREVIECESKNISEVLKVAKNVAKSNESIILSPGFPSFDMFKNFEDRGLQFKEAVNNL